MRQAKRQKHRCQLCYSFVPHLHKERLFEPMQLWKPSKIGVCFSGDLFDMEVKDEWRQAVLDSIRGAYWQTFICLTKQPQNIRQKLYPPNLWIGVTVNTKNDLWRISYLTRDLKDCVDTKFVSFEPLLEDMGNCNLNEINWVIIGGQTRPKLLPKYDWVSSLRTNAYMSGCKVFLKNNLIPILGTNKPQQEFPK
jgi:protein gp37